MPTLKSYVILAFSNNATSPKGGGEPSQKRVSGVAQVVGPEFKPQYWKKKEERKSSQAQELEAK
jgi:hypothetical protein